MNSASGRGTGGSVDTVQATPSHRAAAAASTGASASTKPVGHVRMWLVAWRLHRIQAGAMLAIMAVAAAAMALFRWRVVATFRDLGCDLFPADPNGLGCINVDGSQVWWNDGFSSWSALAHLGMLAAPVVLGAFAAAPVFTREFSRGTHVLALTQSVSRRHWFVAKTTVLVVPLVAGLLALAAVMRWTDGVVSITAYNRLEKLTFFTASIVPAAVGLTMFALTIAIGMIARSLLPTLVTGILVGGVLLFGLVTAQPHVLPADRTVTTMAEQYPAITQAMIDAENAQATGTHVAVPTDPDQRYVGMGYLNAAGDTVDLPNRTMSACYDRGNKAGEAAATAAGLSAEAGDATSGSGTAIAAHSTGDAFYNSPEYRTAQNEAMRDCIGEAGVVAQYSDILPGGLLWPLRWAMTGICALLAALFLGASVWRLQPALAKR